jgi:hypothetical protein
MSNDTPPEVPFTTNPIPEQEGAHFVTESVAEETTDAVAAQSGTEEAQLPFDIEAFSVLWVEFSESLEVPFDFQGSLMPEVRRMCDVMQDKINNHVLDTEDLRLASLYHLLGMAILQAEVKLKPMHYQYGAIET